jgi:hypothetical protein
MQVHFDTYKVPGQRAIGDRSVDLYSVEVTVKGDRREVRCSALWNGHITVWGLAVRFQTGTKVWPGSANYWVESGNINNLRPDIDKRGHVSLVGFSSDFEDKACRSRHNAVA